MSEPEHAPDAHDDHHHDRTLGGYALLYLRHLQRYLITGLMVWVPMIITLWVTWFVFVRVGLGVENLIREVIIAVNEFNSRFAPLRHFTIQYYRGLGFLTALVLFLTTGFLTRYLVWRRVIAMTENVLNFIPGINKVYKAVQQIRDVFVGREGSVFQEVVLIEYPRKGMVAVGFVTARDQGVVQQEIGFEAVAVFVPTTPNPTSGFLLYVQPDEMKVLNVSIEDAMKLIVSGGAFIPQRIEELAVPTPGKPAGGQKSEEKPKSAKKAG